MKSPESHKVLQYFKLLGHFGLFYLHGTGHGVLNIIIYNIVS